MNWLKHINLGPKLIGACVISALLTLIVGCFGLFNQQAASVRTEQIYQDNVLAMQALTGVQKHLLLHARTLVRAMTQASNPKQQAETIERARGYWVEEQKAWDQYMRIATGASNASLRDEIIGQALTYARLSDSAINLLQQGAVSEAADLLNGEVRSASKKFEATLDKLIQENVDQAARANAAAELDAAHAFTLTVAAIAAAMIFALIVGWVLTKSMTSAIHSAMVAAQRITSNDLSQPIVVEGSDEIAQLSIALRDMQETLRRTLQQIAGSSSQLAAASEELHAVTEEMSRSMDVQNDQMQMAAAAVTQMSAAVDEVARSADATSAASTSAESTARLGRDQVSETKQGIDELSQIVSSTSANMLGLVQQVEEISGVLDVIGEIADQTNLLALNAAIEAARAGEQGRGFSVVADEVRALAGRTQLSTREIASIIDKVKAASHAAAESMQASNAKVQITRDLADGADNALGEISTAISQINEMNLTIASASEQQAQTAREVDRNLVAIKDFGLQNAAGALQTSASTNELARIATALNAMVGEFKL